MLCGFFLLLLIFVFARANSTPKAVKLNFCARTFYGNLFSWNAKEVKILEWLIFAINTNFLDILFSIFMAHEERFRNDILSAMLMRKRCFYIKRCLLIMEP